MVLIQLLGGPTALLEVDGLRLVTDPTFDPPGDYARPNAPTLVKLAGPAVSADEIARADVVLLSHDQHADNLDQAGRAYLAKAPLTLTTPSGAGGLPKTGSPRAAWRRGSTPTCHARGASRSGSPRCPPGTGLRAASRSAARSPASC